MANTFKFGNGNWAVKDGYALAYNDENNNFKPLPFDFTRASSATTLNRQGLIETVGSGKPRIDFLDNTSGHLLLEPSRTNNLQRSEEFENSYWINNGVTITANQTISPDGNLTADLLTGVSGGFAVVVFSTWSSTNKVASCFAKKGSTNLFKIANVSSGGGGVTFNVESGIITNTDSGFEGTMEDYGNGWYRCIAIDTLGRSGTFSLGVTAASESVYIWGAQLEAGSYATSYIPTEGSSVTRVAETANGAGNSTVFNDSEGVLFLEAAMLSSNPNNSTFQIDDGTSTHRVRIRFTTTTNQINGLLYSGVSGQPNINYTANDVTNQNKVAIRYQVGQIDLFVNGTKVGTSTGNATPTGFDNLSLGTEGKVKDLKVYNTALTDTELQNLTS